MMAISPPRERALNPLDRRLGGPQNWSGFSGKETESLPLP